MKQRQFKNNATGIFISARDSYARLDLLVQLLDMLNSICDEKFDVVLVEDGVVADPPLPSPPSLPRELDVSEIRQMLQALADCGELTADWQLLNQSWTERAELVAFLSGKLGVRCMWSAFANFWHCDKSALKSAYAKHGDTEAARKYYVKLEKILR